MDSHLPVIQLRTTFSKDDLGQVRRLLHEYMEEMGGPVDRQEIVQEIARFPGEYAEPLGCMVLAYVDGALAGCCAMRALPAADHSNAGEMKRLYVRKAFRGFGLGRILAQQVLESAQLAGYSCLLLDTLEPMGSARALYEDLGFEEIEPYYFTSRPNALFMKADLL